MRYNIKLKAKSTFSAKDSSINILFVENEGKKTDLSFLESLLKEGLNNTLKKELFDEEIKKVVVQTCSQGTVNIYKYDKKELTVDFFRDSVSELVQNMNNHVNELNVAVPDYEQFKILFSEENYFLQTFAEGALLGNYDFDVYKSQKKKTTNLVVNIISGSTASIKKAIAKAERIIDAVYFSRDLVNEPAITLTPQEFVKRVKKEFSGTGVKVKVMNQAELKKNKMNSILSVGKGSNNPPMMLVLHYKPSGAKDKIALVGKGVTYDSGGYSIKPTDGMVEMKGDMAGGAAVVGAIKAAASLSVKKEIYGIIPLVENLIDGKAYKPGDIVSTASGKTIEVKNTDAEGRIILADALEYASKQKPGLIIDFATLTGACVVALGEFAAGMFTKNEEVASKLSAAGNKTYEFLWPLPFYDVYKKLLKSDIADISNLGPRWGGAITAAKFLENFVDENIPYVHLDIAGPSLKHELSSYTKKWATGFGVRLMSEFLEK